MLRTTYIRSPYTYIHVRELPNGNVTVQVRQHGAAAPPRPQEVTPDAAADYLVKQPQCGVEILCFDKDGERIDAAWTVENALRSKHRITMTAAEPCAVCGGSGTVNGQPCPRSIA